MAWEDAVLSLGSWTGGCCLVYTSTSSSLIRGWWLSASVSTGPSTVSVNLRPVIGESSNICGNNGKHLRHLATAPDYLPTSFGETSRPKNTITPPANCTTDVTRKAYCTQQHKAYQHIWICVISLCLCASDLVSIVKHTRSQESPQDVAYRSTSAPQTKHEAPSGKKHHVQHWNKQEREKNVHVPSLLHLIYLDFFPFPYAWRKFPCPNRKEKPV